MPDNPLRPDEREAYKTAVDTEYEPEPASASPASDPRPWIVIGLVLLAIFATGLVAAILTALP